MSEQTIPEEGLSELERVAAEFFADETPDIPDEGDEPTGESEADDAEEVEPEPEVVGVDQSEPPAGDDQGFEYGGRTLSRAEMEERLGFYDLVETNPALALHLANFFQAGGTAEPSSPVPPAQPQITLPEGFDPDDPVVQALTPVLQYQYERLNALSSNLEQVQGQLYQRQQADSEAIVTRVTADFAKRHDLTEVELGKVRDAASRLEVLPALLKGVDPISGMPVKPDTMSAVDRALEIAYWQFPEMRDREMQKTAVKEKADKTRKAKLGAVSGTSGGQTRTPPPVEDTRDARIAYMTNMMRGEG